MKYLNRFESHEEKFVQFSQLIGKIIDAVYLSEDETALCFACEDGSYETYYTDGDCCNSVWFTHLTGYDVLLNQRVISVESRDWREVADRIGEDGCEEACTWVLTTKRGYIDIEVRNNHNGYYGGRVDHCSGSPEMFSMSEIHDDF